MKNRPMIIGMILATAMAPVWAAEKAQPAPAGTNPPATIAWGEAVDGVQVGLVPLGGVGWAGFECPHHARQRHAMPSPEEKQKAVKTRCCELCGVPKPWSATFTEGEPMRMELHFRSLAKEARRLYDAGYGVHWSFTFTPVGGGMPLRANYSAEDDRDGLSHIELGSGERQEAAVELELRPGWWSFRDPQGRQLQGVRVGKDNLIQAPSDPGSCTNMLRSVPAGKYTVTASYAHPEHAQRKLCDYWHGTVTTGPVEIEIKPGAPETDAQRKAGQEAEPKAQIERKQHIDHEREMKQRAMEERGQ